MSVCDLSLSSKGDLGFAYELALGVLNSSFLSMINQDWILTKLCYVCSDSLQVIWNWMTSFWKFYRYVHNMLIFNYLHTNSVWWFEIAFASRRNPKMTRPHITMFNDSSNIKCIFWFRYKNQSKKHSCWLYRHIFYLFFFKLLSSTYRMFFFWYCSSRF